VREMCGGLYRVSLGWLWPSRKVSRSYMPLCPGEILLARATSGCIKMSVGLTFPYFPNKELRFGSGLVSRDPLACRTPDLEQYKSISGREMILTHHPHNNYTYTRHIGVGPSV
jgi:hypothetical protein